MGEFGFLKMAYKSYSDLGYDVGDIVTLKSFGGISPVYGKTWNIEESDKIIFEQDFIKV